MAAYNVKIGRVDKLEAYFQQILIIQIFTILFQICSIRIKYFHLTHCRLNELPTLYILILISILGMSNYVI